jgi:hypothetical protein
LRRGRPHRLQQFLSHLHGILLPQVLEIVGDVRVLDSVAETRKRLEDVMWVLAEQLLPERLCLGGMIGSQGCIGSEHEEDLSHARILLALVHLCQLEIHLQDLVARMHRHPPSGSPPLQ